MDGMKKIVTTTDYYPEKVLYPPQYYISMLIMYTLYHVS